MFDNVQWIDELVGGHYRLLLENPEMLFDFLIPVLLGIEFTCGGGGGATIMRFFVLLTFAMRFLW